MERQRRRRKQLLDYDKETREYWKLEGEALIARCGVMALKEAMNVS